MLHSSTLQVHVGWLFFLEPLQQRLRSLKKGVLRISRGTDTEFTHSLIAAKPVFLDAFLMVYKPGGSNSWAVLGQGVPGSRRPDTRLTQLCAGAWALHHGVQEPQEAYEYRYPSSSTHMAVMVPSRVVCGS